MADDAIQRVLDPNSGFPQQSLRSQEEQEHIKGWVGPAGSGKNMNLSNTDPVRQGYSQGADLTEGINRDVGQHLGTAPHRTGARHMAASVGSDKPHSGTTNE